MNPPWIVDTEAGKNVTLTCNASGDPLPSITWTKIGVAHDQFNFTGHKLHILNVKRTDVGLYRCTANNGFGREATRVSVVNINCKGGFRLRKIDRRKTELALSYDQICCIALSVLQTSKAFLVLLFRHSSSRADLLGNSRLLERV